ncbi:hypothetical protein Ndes2526A_g00512 [Nannochloris sp. 'desiccata']
MASGKSNFKTPDQPSRVKRGVIDPSPNLNLVYQTLPDLTPPRKNKYSDPFSTIGAAGASPSVTEFGFPRPHDSSPGAFRSGSDGKSDPSFDLFGFRSTPAKGRSPAFDLSSPRSTGLHPPPVPIFQPSPRRASDASTYVSPESRNRRSSLTTSGAGGKAFSFSPQPAFASPPPTGAGGGAGTSAGATNNVHGGHASFTSVFASILGDAHSRISPTNLSAAAAAARDGSAVRAHFGGIFTAADAAAGGGPSTGGNAAAAGGASGSDAQPGTTSMLVPVNGLHPSGGSPLQLHQTTPVSANTNSEGDEDDDGDDTDGYDAVAARRPSRRRALDFNGAAAAAGAGGINGNGITDMNVTTSNNNDNGMSKYEISNPLSPSMGPVVIESIEALLPIPRLRDSGDEESGQGGSGDRGGLRGPVLVPSSTRGVSGTTAGGVSLLPGLTRRGGVSGGAGMSFMDSLAQSPISMRPGIIRREDIIDSPAVKEATNAAVAAALQANAEKRPARAAAAGAAAAAAAAAGGTPMSRRLSAAHHAAGNYNSGLFDASGLLSATGTGVPAGGVRCNCKKSRCLKLYCDCFKTLGYCGEGCSCVGCSNREDNAPAVNTARESILQRNPQAFSEKISALVDTTGNALGDVFGGGSGSLGINSAGAPVQAQHRRGCNCKKSKCLKKYCECFQAGIPCGDSCKCDGCHNTVEAMASGRPPFHKKRLQQQQQQQSAPTLPSLQQQVQQQVQAIVKTSSEEESESADGSVKPTSASVPARSTSGAAAAAAAPGMQQFAALGPAFQQILLQQAFTRNGGANGAAVRANCVTPPPGGHGNGKPGSLTVNNQLLVPISWPMSAGAAGAGAANGGGGGVAVASNATTAQQLLNLAASNANPAFSNQFAAAIAAAQKNAANVAAAVAAAAAGKNTHSSNGKATPSVGPSSQDENPSSAQAGGTTTTTTATEQQQQQQPSDGTEAVTGEAPRQGALLRGGIPQQQQPRQESSHRSGSGASNRRKPPLPLGGATATPATAGGSSSGSDGEKPRLTPTKRKPARTMTAALS